MIWPIPDKVETQSTRPVWQVYNHKHTSFILLPPVSSLYCFFSIQKKKPKKKNMWEKKSDYLYSIFFRN